MKRWLRRLVAFVRPGQAELELAREVASHLALLEDEYRRLGMTDDEARFAARRAIGGVEQVKELQRAARSFAWLEDARQDARFAVRALRRQPAFAAVAILTLALGIGATSAIFSVVNVVLLRPLPYAHPDRLVRIVENVPAEESFRGVAIRLPAMSIDEFDFWRTHLTTFAHLAVSVPEARTLRLGRGNVRLAGARVTPSLFDIRGIQPVLGRGLRRDEERPDAGVVVLSAATWRTHFGGAADIVNRTIFLDDAAHTVVGVMPSSFGGEDFWTPFVVEPLRPGQLSIVPVTGLLAERTSFEAAAAEVNMLGGRLRNLPSPVSGVASRFELVQLQDEAVARVRPALHVLIVAVGVVLLIVCANVANLLLMRAAKRRQEMAVRRALGAARGRVLRQVLTESVVLSTAGAAAGLALAYMGIRTLKALAVVELPAGFSQALNTALLPRIDDIAIDSSVLAFTVATAVLAGLVFGSAPALRFTRTDQRDLRGGPPVHAFRSGRVLAAAQLTAATTLLVGAALLMHSFVRLTTTDLGFDAAKTLSFDLVLPGHYFAERKLQIAEAISERLASLPGVSAAGFTDGPPLSNRTARPYGAFRPPLKPGDPQDEEWVDQRLVSSDYLKAIGVRLTGGRWLQPSDRRARPGPILVTRTYVNYYFGPGANAVGSLLDTRSGPAVIVGIVDDVRFDGIDTEPRPIGFVDPRHALDVSDAMLAERGRTRGAEGNRLFLTGFNGTLAYAVRTGGGEPLDLARDVRRIVNEIEPAAAIDSMMPLESVVSSTVAQPRFYAVLTAVFGGGAAVIAVIGIYGVLAYLVTQRTREIGIRMALGAQRDEVLWLVMRQGAALIALGVGAGLAGALGTTRYLEGMLYGLTPLDLPTYAAVGIVFAAVAAIASCAPARRATRVDPVTALRIE